MVKRSSQGKQQENESSQGANNPPSRAQGVRPKPPTESIASILNFVSLYNTPVIFQPVVLTKKFAHQHTCGNEAGPSQGVGNLRNVFKERSDAGPSQKGGNVRNASGRRTKARSGQVVKNMGNARGRASETGPRQEVAILTPRKYGTMELRSLVRVTFNRFSRPYNSKRNKSMPPPSTRGPIILPRRRSLSSSIEDNRPLRHIATNNRYLQPNHSSTVVYGPSTSITHGQDRGLTTSSYEVNNALTPFYPTLANSPTVTSTPSRIYGCINLRSRTVARTCINTPPLIRNRCMDNRLESISSSVEDNRPLTYIAAKYRRNVNRNHTGQSTVANSKTIKRVTKLTSTRTRSVNKSKQSKTGPVRKKKPTLKNKRVAKKTAQRKQQKSNRNTRKPVADASTDTNVDVIIIEDDENDNQTITEGARSGVNKTTNVNPNLTTYLTSLPNQNTTPENRSAECELIPSTNVTTLAPSHYIPPTTPSISTDMFIDDGISYVSPNQEAHGNQATSEADMINKRRSVNEWLLNSCSPDMNAFPQFKIPEPPRPRTTRPTSLRERELRKRCPAWRCTSMSAMAKTPPETMKLFCGECSRCSMFHKLIKLAKHIPNRRNSTSSVSSRDQANMSDHLIDEPNGSASVDSRENNNDKEPFIDVEDHSIDIKEHSPHWCVKFHTDPETIMTMLQESDPECDIHMLENEANEITILDSFTCQPSTSQPVLQEDRNNTVNLEKEQDALSVINEFLITDQTNESVTSDGSFATVTLPIYDRPLTSQILEAPTFYPTAEEMSMDFVEYIKKIAPLAAKFGICKITPPPEFKSDYVMKNVQFETNNQYISTMFDRWGNASKEMTAIKAHLATQNVPLTELPLIESLEVDLVKLYHQVQKHGGFTVVNEQQKWDRIADAMQLNTDRIKAVLKLDQIYCQYLMSYDRLTPMEREDLKSKVDRIWQKRFKRMCERAANPLHRKRRLLGESDSSEDESEEEFESRVVDAFKETENCVLPGQKMNLSRFFQLAADVHRMQFPISSKISSPDVIERLYWLRVLRGDEHVCVYSASTETSTYGIGFPVDNNHPWNLKCVRESDSNILSALNSVNAATASKLHLSMIFSTNCWYMDPHRLFRTEYMHSGLTTIWYGIPEEQADTFRAAVEQLCPAAVQNKSIWLPSDFTMIPPEMLVQKGVTLSRLQQKSGDFVLVLPSAYSCSISTGYSVSESLYFATETWLNTIEEIFSELRSNCETTMFALEQLGIGLIHARNPMLARRFLEPIIINEKVLRHRAAVRGFKLATRNELLEQSGENETNRPWQILNDVCHVCRSTLYFSKIVGLSPSGTSVCLQHGLQMFDNNSTEPNAILCILFFSDSQITKLLNILKLKLSRNKNDNFMQKMEDKKRHAI